MYDVFQLLLLEKNISRKKQVNKVTFQLKFDVKDDNSKEFQVEAIYDNEIYVIELENNHLLGIYYMVTRKDCAKENDTWRLVFAI